MTTSCPACTLPVLEATAPGGGSILLNPRPSPRGKFAVCDTRGGGLAARLITGSSPVRDHESRHNGHTCAGQGGALDQVRREQAGQAAAARNRRGRPVRRDPLARATGVRWVPPDGGSAA